MYKKLKEDPAPVQSEGVMTHDQWLEEHKGIGGMPSDYATGYARYYAAYVLAQRESKLLSDVAKIKAWIAENRPNLTGLGALNSLLNDLVDGNEFLDVEQKGVSESAGESSWDWDDYENNDKTGNKLKELRTNNPVRYKELFDKKFSA